MSEEAKTPVELSKDAEKIMELVEKLPVLELANLVTALEDKFNVSAAAPMMMAGAMSISAHSNQKYTRTYTSSVTPVLLARCPNQALQPTARARYVRQQSCLP